MLDIVRLLLDHGADIDDEWLTEIDRETVATCTMAREAPENALPYWRGIELPARSGQ